MSLSICDDKKSIVEETAGFKIFLRDISQPMVDAWRDTQAFGCESFTDSIQISQGDIFQGAPAADAIVSPANSYGFMDGGIDMVYSRHFGWQMQERLQKLLREEHDGELPVGQAVIIPAYSSLQGEGSNLSPSVNQGTPISYLIAAPTMRIPTNVSKTVNSYLAFRAILREVREHNRCHPDKLISSVLCPGLGTAVGRMPFMRCAHQMRTAYNAVIHRNVPAINCPRDLSEPCSAHVQLTRFGENSGTKFPPKATIGELFIEQ
ncbi:uncharacterized protein LOC135349874 [Halichondria panicea]|uniref:uncharacterized protein LOC135349874 n=1 Tax=Halichondria panicea TaxID=6063 RepID=UPI00312BAA1F